MGQNECPIDDFGTAELKGLKLYILSKGRYQGIAHGEIKIN